MDGYSCVMNRDCDGIEMAFEVAKVLTVELKESGPAWASKQRCESGWVPMASG